MTDPINTIDIQEIHDHIKSIKCNNIKDAFNNNCIENKVKKLCPDNYVGQIIANSDQNKVNLWFHPILRFKNKDKISVTNYSSSEKNKNTSSQNVAIILESPHIAEYEFDFFINPALGITGSNLHKYFYIIFKYYIKEQLENEKLNENETFHIYLINAIQYPTSLLNRPIDIQLRDDIFKHLWKCKKIEKDFVERLKKINPDIIINACTGGENKDGLRTLVENSIKKQLNQNIKYCTSSHPSAPNFSTQTSFELE